MFSYILKHIFVVFHRLHLVAYIVAFHLCLPLHALCFLERADPSIPETEVDPEVPQLCEPVHQGKQPIMFAYCTRLIELNEV